MKITISKIKFPFLLRWMERFVKIEHKTFEVPNKPKGRKIKKIITDELPLDMSEKDIKKFQKQMLEVFPKEINKLLLSTPKRKSSYSFICEKARKKRASDFDDTSVGYRVVQKEGDYKKQ